MRRRVALCLVVVALAALMRPPPPSRAQPRQAPDIVVIVSDDQSFDMMRYLPATEAWLPVRYTHAYVTTPACCPSRTTILTSLEAHDSGVWGNKGAYGGWLTFQAQRLMRQTIAVALQGAGYRTGLFGKYLNGWKGDPSAFVGWNEFEGHTYGATAGTSSPYYNYMITQSIDGVRSTEAHGSAPSDYSTDVYTAKVESFIADAPANQPLFVYYTPHAPHSATGEVPPIPAPQDVNTAVTLPALRPNVNEADVSDKPWYIRRRGTVDLATVNGWRTAVARTLLDLDRSVDQIMTTIQQTRDLSNTLVIFISDNGYLYGSHRWLGKDVPYEESIRVPMLARFPGSTTVTTDGRLALNADIAVTAASYAGITFPTNDGLSLDGSKVRTSFVTEGSPETKHTFCGVHTRNQVYVQYGTGEAEFYDLRTDPYELSNHPNAVGAKLRSLWTTDCTPLPPGW
jgi:N-acetylglucosamine-6-sulfatase